MRRRTLALFATSLVGCGGVSAPVASTAPPVPVAALTTTPAAPPPREDGRLPPGVHPTRYALDLTVDPSKKLFQGHARIGVSVEQPTATIVMHGRGLQVASAALQTPRGRLSAKPLLRKAVGSKVDAEELVLSFDAEVPAGEGELDLLYEAPFSDGLRGLYRVEEGGAWYAFTHFEPNDARRAFPCFDEPGFKTPFDLSISVPPGATAIANTREVRRRDDAVHGWVTFEFEKSPPLPSYLLAFGVGPLDVLEGAKQPAPVRLVAAHGKAGLGRLAVEAAAAHLDLLGKYFDRPYPYSKLDVVAVPNFGSGAMENPGFVTFREELLLLDPDHVSVPTRRRAEGVIAHELAHQWFGDLVTMRWWDDLWLNEAFASWMSDKILDQWRPNTLARLEALENKAKVMSHDSLAFARKVRNPVRSTSEAAEAFDAITYDKGRAVLTMVEAWLGEDAFREGLRRYVKKHAWGNATAADLYASLGEASAGRDVAKVMDSFTNQTGVPLVSAKLSCSQGAPPVVELHQQEYRTRDRRDPSDKLWRVPICVLYEAGGKVEKECTLLDGANGRLPLAAAAAKGSCPAFVYPNAGETGYYRSRMDEADLEKLLAVAFTKLSERERFGLVSNAWADVWSGDLAPSGYLKMLRSFKKETSRVVWIEIFESLRQADRSVVSDASRPAFARLVRDLVGPVAKRLGFAPKKDEPEEDKLLRLGALDLLGTLGDDEPTLVQARRAADAWIADPAKADPDLARLAVPLAARKGDAALFDRLLGVTKKAKTPEIRLVAVSGLAAFEDPKLVERTLDLTLDGTLKAQDTRYIVAPLAGRRATRDATYAWMEKHFDDLAGVAPAFLLGRFVQVVAYMCNVDRVRAAEAFFHPRVAKIEGTEKDLRQATEAGFRCAELADKESTRLEKSLAEVK